MNIVYNYFLTELFKGNIDFENDNFRVALLAEGYVPNPAHTTLASIRAYESDGNGYTLGGKPLENVRFEERDGVPYVLADDTIWEDTSLSVKCAVLTKEGNLVACYDFGEVKTSLNGTFTIEWDKTGILTLEQ